MKKLKIYRLNVLMTSFILLQGCTGTVVESKYLNVQDLNKLIGALENNQNLDQQEKAFLIEYLDILKTFPYVDKEALENEFSKIDVSYIAELPYSSQTMILEENRDTSIVYSLFYNLHGENNGEFMNKGVSSLLTKEYGNGVVYPFQQIVAGMFTEIYGTDLVLQSFMTDYNLLQEEISKTADSELAKILFSEFEEYEKLLKDKSIDKSLLKSKEKIIILFMEIIYKCQFNKPVEENENMMILKNSVENSNLLLQLKNYYNKKDIGLVKKLTFDSIQ